METVRLTVAQALVRFLDQQYVRRDGVESKFVAGVLGIFGHGNLLGIGQALAEPTHGLRFVLAHNEQAMVHSAVAFAKQSRRMKIWACTSSIGPGALNMVTGAALATVNRIPVLLLPGDVFADRQPDPVLQQLEVPGDPTVSVNDALRPLSRYWDRITRPEQLMSSCLQAMRVLTDPAEAGAVTLCLPQDVQAQAFDWPLAFFRRRVHEVGRRPPDPAALERAVQRMQASRRPLIVAGGGVRYAAAEAALQELAEATGVPVVETQAGKGSLAWDHPLNLGGVGVTGSRVGNAYARAADLILAVGTRLGDFTTASKTAFAPEAAIVQLNVQPFDAVKMDAEPLVCDARVGLQALREKLQASGYRAAYAAEDLASQRAAWQAEADGWLYGGEGPGLGQTRALGVLWEAIEPEAVIVNAAGSLPGDLHRLWRCRAPGGYHLEYGFSCMGYEIAGALGVRWAEPERPVYALVGDGSYLMLHGEILTSLREHTKVIVVVFDNGGFRSIQNLQTGQGLAPFGNEFRRRNPATGRLDGERWPVDFARYGESLGAVGLAASDPASLRAAVAAAQAADRTAVIHVKITPGQETPNFDSWWRVGVAEVPDSPARQAMTAARERARPW